MMGSGFLSQAVMEKANEKLEGAIEDLRIKYAKKAEEEKAAAAEAAKEAAAAKAVEDRKAGKAETDFVMDDPEIEALRRVRAALP